MEMTAKILIVEDEGIEALSLQQKLKARGYSVPEIVYTGEDAVKKAAQISPDLVLMDIMLHGEMDGITAAEKIHASFDIPIIYITAYADDETLKRAKITEPYGYIVKPFKERELQISIEMALYKHKAEEALRKAHDELEIRVQDRTSELQEVNKALQAEIEERKRAEEALRKAHDELEIRVQERTAELARSNAELEQFAYIASHDLQEPLRMISGFTRLLERRYKGRLDSSADEFIAYIVDGAARMQRMIEDLLAYSRVGTLGKQFEPTNLEAIFEEAMTNLKVSIEENKSEITHDPLPTVMADATQIVQLLQNLISNGIKFRKREEVPRVHVSAGRKGDEWVFSVKDNGIGISPEFMGHLFQLFQRERTAGEYPGTGIGLAICKKIVERHSGRIWAESEHGRGSTFYFTIPDCQ